MIHHLAFRTAHVELLADFYRDWLGLLLVRDARPRSLWLSRGGPCVLMIEARDDGEPLLPAHSQELVAFGVSSRQRQRLRRRLLAQGKLEAETEHTLYFRDPDGRRVAVSSYPLPVRPLARLWLALSRS